MRDDSSTVNTEAEVPVVDGVWLRRERERIAIGRRQVAERLGVPESQVSRVEMNKRLVPSEWFAGLAALGFPIPGEAPSPGLKAALADAVNPPALVDAPPPVEPASVAEAIASVPTSSAVSAAGPCAIEVAPPSPPPPEVAPEPAAERSVAAPQSAALPSTPSADPPLSSSVAPSAGLLPSDSPERAEPPAVPSPEPSARASTAPSDAIGAVESPGVATSPASPHRRPAPAVPDATPLRGRWLRAQRQACDVSQKRLCLAFGIPKTSLPHLERNDLPLPSAWLPKLAELGLLPDGSLERLAASPPATVRYTGRWLRRERKSRGMLHIAIAPALHVASASLEIIEARDWPLPPEWLPILHHLGLPVSEVPAARLALSTPSTDSTPSDATPKVPRKRAARDAHSPNSKPVTTSQGTSKSKSLTGAWLRQVRLQRSITQVWLSQQLNVNQTKLWRCESQNQTLPPGWLPTLRRLGFLSPSPQKAEPSTAVSPAQAIQPGTKKAARAVTGQTLDGRWLKAERDRLKLSVHALTQALHVSHTTYARFETPHVVLPRSWWPTLRQVGLRVPATLPVPNTRPTPASGSPDGAWLAKERKRLAISEYDACYALRSTQRMLRRVERQAADLPKAWIAKLPVLGIAVQATSAPPRPAGKTSRPSRAIRKLNATSGEKPANPAASLAPETAKPAPSTTAASHGPDLVGLIVNFRLALGQHTGQPPFEILSRILSDLRDAGADQVLTHADVDRAARALIQKR
jgi:transcriptional regulator with XRE-family HTH domain